ncbi:Myosin-binding protein 2 [Linum perenne]
MAVPNKFATNLYTNTNRFTVVLVYAALEWTLISFLLLNSLFSYLIIKFSDYFGLHRPCLLCSRLDHLFDPSNSYRSLVCDDHAREISQLGYCSTHGKLVESKDLCHDCSGWFLDGLSKGVGFFPWKKHDCSGSGCENDEICCCCGVALGSRSFRHECSPVESYWGDAEKEDLGFGDIADENEGRIQMVVGEDNVEIEEGLELGDVQFSLFESGFEFRKMEFVADGVDEGRMMSLEVEEKGDDLSFTVVDGSEFSATIGEISSEVSVQPPQQQHLEFFIDQDDCGLIPVEFAGASKSKEVGGDEDLVFEFDSYELVVEEKFSPDEKVPLLSIPEQDEEEEEDEEEDDDEGNESFHVEEMEQSSAAEAAADCFSYELVLEDERFCLDEKVPLLSIMEQEQEEGVKNVSFSVVNWDDLVEELEQCGAAEPTSTPRHDENGDEEGSTTVREELEDDDSCAMEDPATINEEKELEKIAQTEATAAAPLEMADQMDFQVSEEETKMHMDASEDPSTSNDAIDSSEAHYTGSMAALEEDAVEFRTVEVEGSEPAIDIDIKDDGVPETPRNSIDGFHHLHNVLPLLRRRVDGSEDSLDGSVFGSDLEAGDGVLTMEKLKSIVRDERKVLNALLTELEEERNASTVAANQSMAMITRLQEEKAAMQMEAFQYQRMMEEQADYDREAIEILNDFVVKREREYAELEEELEACRHMLEDYEAKEMVMLKTRTDVVLRSGDSLTSSGSVDDSDSESSQSLDFNLNGKKRFCRSGHDNRQKTPADAVLEQLKGLEERLCMSNSDYEEQDFESSAPIHHSYEESSNGHHDKLDPSSESNGVANGHHHESMNGNHKKERKVNGTKTKRLLPLFDAEAEDGIKLSVSTEEDLDHVYQKLEGLEEDREFLKHCISSLRKGDNGVELLKQILQHLCDLRSVGIHGTSMENGA